MENFHCCLPCYRWKKKIVTNRVYMFWCTKYVWTMIKFWIWERLLLSIKISFEENEFLILRRSGQLKSSHFYLYGNNCWIETKSEENKKICPTWKFKKKKKCEWRKLTCFTLCREWEARKKNAWWKCWQEKVKTEKLCQTIYKSQNWNACY